MNASSFKIALIAAAVSAVVSAGAAVATIQTFSLGTTNRVNAASNVTNVQANGTTVNPVDAALLTLENKSTSANATPLSLLAAPNHPALKVNTQTKVVNLNADQLDGKDSKGFLGSAAPPTGALVGEAWHAATFRAVSNQCQVSDSTDCTWMNYGSGFNTTGYYKDPLGAVHLKGLIKPDCTQSLHATCTAGALIFTLPLGYRPAAQEVNIAATAILGAQYLETGRVDVATDGSVLAFNYDNASSDTWLSLDGITFRAAN
jgi:hypothetical protein